MRTLVFISACLLSSSSIALADPDAAISSAGTLRNGFSLSAGQEFGGDRDIAATMFGVDWRIGWRFSTPVSVHLHSHLSFGSGKEANGASGFTGTFASALVGEYTLPMGVLVGAGAGYGVLNNPNGALVEARVGYYLFGTAGAEKQRRLNVALDYRAFFASQGYGTVSSVALSIGYDTF